MDEPKRVLLGVSGGIAAYKSCEVLRLLQKAGYDVTVIMTEAATRFVGPVTFEALSGHPVGLDMFGDAFGPAPHITLAGQCDGMLIAPATADTLARLAHGGASDLLSATALALPDDVPLLVAPAMNVHMYEHPATQANLETLRSRNVVIIEAESGYLACGEVGPGRLASPETIADAVGQTLGAAEQDYQGLGVLITAGPTQEPIDPVRYLTNHSSGKMGYALAEAARDRGARVTLISGPVAIDAPYGVERISVVTAEAMLQATEQAFGGCDVGIFTAAVADYRPVGAVTTKLKKGRDDERLALMELTPNPDILATAAAHKTPEQVVVGFAAETEDVIEGGRAKLEAKGADLIVANGVGDGKAFGRDDNEAALITAELTEELPLMSKRELADRILDRVLTLR